MENPRAVAKRIAELHNKGMKPSVEEATAVGEEVIRRMEDTVQDAYARTADESMQFNQKLLAIAHANADAYFEWVREVIRVTSPSEFIAASMKHSRQQFETFGQQTRELVGLAQKAALRTWGHSEPAFVVRLSGDLIFPDYEQPQMEFRLLPSRKAMGSTISDQ